MVAINKTDGDNVQAAQRAKVDGVLTPDHAAAELLGVFRSAFVTQRYARACSPDCPRTQAVCDLDLS